jgi:hypothetical protein
MKRVREIGQAKIVGGQVFHLAPNSSHLSRYLHRERDLYVIFA